MEDDEIRQLREQVAARADGTPYVVEQDPGRAERFAVSVDLADARWLTLASRQRLRRHVTHEVTLRPEKRTYTIVDVSRELRWSAGAPGGAPSFTFTGKIERGHIIERRRHQVHAWDDHGDYGPVVDYSLDTREGHDLIRTVMSEHGWEERQGASQRAAKIVFAVTMLIALFTAVALIFGAVTGQFGD